LLINPVFMISSLGSPLLILVAGLLQLHPDGPVVLPWIIAALVSSLVTLDITFGINIPLNNALDAAGPPAPGDDPAAAREAFEARRVRYNVLRTWTSVVAFGCLVLYAQTSAT
jgi:uncharacterized membrane protein